MKQIAVVAPRDGRYAGQVRLRGEVFMLPATEAAALVYRHGLKLASKDQIAEADKPTAPPAAPEPTPTPRRRRTYRRRDLTAEPA